MTPSRIYIVNATLVLSRRPCEVCDGTGAVPARRIAPEDPDSATCPACDARNPLVLRRAA